MSYSFSARPYGLPCRKAGVGMWVEKGKREKTETGFPGLLGDPGCCQWGGTLPFWRCSVTLPGHSGVGAPRLAGPACRLATGVWQDGLCNLWAQPAWVVWLAGESLRSPSQGWLVSHYCQRLWCYLCFPGSSDSKEPFCQCRRLKRHGFYPWVGKIPWREGTATHSSILAWRIPWIEEPGGLQFMGLQRAECDWGISTHSRWVSLWAQPLSTWSCFQRVTVATILRLLEARLESGRPAGKLW